MNIFYSDEEDHNNYLKVDLNASLFMRPPPLNLHHESPPHPSQDVESKDLPSCNANNKNKYINRISAMVSDGNKERLSEASKVLSEKRVRLDAEDIDAEKSTGKLAKSRLSAKMSRERKKLYMEMMETQVANLEKDVQRSKEELETTKGFLDKLVRQNQTISGFTASKHQTMKKLQQIVQKQGEEDTNEINCILDSLRVQYRIGANGKERVNTLNQYFKQIVNISFPALHRYMMWTASEGKHLFKEESDDNQDWFKELFDHLGLTEQQKKEILVKREEFSEQKDVLLSLIEALDSTKKKIQVKSGVLEDEVDGIRNILTPIQCAKFVIFIQRNKYRKQLNIWDKEYNPKPNQAQSKCAATKKEGL